MSKKKTGKASAKKEVVQPNQEQPTPPPKQVTPQNIANFAMNLYEGKVLYSLQIFCQLFTTVIYDCKMNEGGAWQDKPKGIQLNVKRIQFENTAQGFHCVLQKGDEVLEFIMSNTESTKMTEWFIKQQNAVRLRQQQDKEDKDKPADIIDGGLTF